MTTRYKHTTLYEDFKKEQLKAVEKDPREKDHIIANISLGTYPKELKELLAELREESIKLMDMRIAFLEISKNDFTDREAAKKDLITQFKKVATMESEFQRQIAYEEREYTEQI